jgi:hypothetical protein
MKEDVTQRQQSQEEIYVHRTRLVRSIPNIIRHYIEGLKLCDYTEEAIREAVEDVFMDITELYLTTFFSKEHLVGLIEVVIETEEEKQDGIKELVITHVAKSDRNDAE